MRSASDFPATSWSMVRQAVSSSDETAREALEGLYRLYDQPVLEFIRRSGYRESDAEDLKQSFFVALHAKDFFAAADEGKGSLRAFLVTHLDRFIASQRRRDMAQKRGGGKVGSIEDLTPLQQRKAEPADALTPYVAYQRKWLRALSERVMARLRAEYEARGKGAYFEAIAPYLSARGDEGQLAIAEKYGRAPGTVKSDVSRLKDRCGALFEEEIAATLEHPTREGVRAEIRELSAYGD